MINMIIYKKAFAPLIKKKNKASECSKILENKLGIDKELVKIIDATLYLAII